jgi:DNA-binding beta-propeller fold protein YncE
VRTTRFVEIVVGDSVRPAGDGLAMLLGRVNGIGPAKLALVSGEGELRRIPLEGITAGFDPPPMELGRGEMPVATQRVPALAIDEAAGKAYVVEAGGPSVVEVDLASGAATRHEPGTTSTALQWLRDLVEGEAEAKGVEGPWRSAHVVGDGLLAVSGYDDRLRNNRQEPHPYGLRLIDTREWSVETVDPRIGHFVPVPGAILVADGGYGRNEGVVALERRRRFQRLAGRDAAATAVGGLVYVTPYGPSRTHVVDLRSGRTVRVLPPGEPPLLIPPPLP